MPVTGSPHHFDDATYTREWVGYNEEEYPQRGQLIDEIVRVVNLQPGPVRVLELGGGAGRLAEAIQRGCEVEAYDLVDSSAEMRTLAATRLAGSSTTFVDADFSTSSWVDRVSREYDVVVTMQALHELRNPARAPLLYSQVAEVARPGAVVVVCDHLPTQDQHRGLYMPPSAHLTAMQAGGLVDPEVICARDAMVLVRGRLPTPHGDTDSDTDGVQLWRRA